MIALAIFSILLSIAILFYLDDRGVSAREGVFQTNIRVIHQLQLDRRRESGDYVEGNFLWAGAVH
jgi:type II secretory pathway pseudopilin PulG